MLPILGLLLKQPRWFSHLLSALLKGLEAKNSKLCCVVPYPETGKNGTKGSPHHSEVLPKSCVSSETCFLVYFINMSAKGLQCVEGSACIVGALVHLLGYFRKMANLQHYLIMMSFICL